MSSVYRLMCLSHIPVIGVVDREWESGNNGFAASEQALLKKDYGDFHTDKCDIVIGRFSYPLIEVGYIQKYNPNKVEWIDHDYIVAIFHAALSTQQPVLAKLNKLEFWTADRLASISTELRLD